MAEASAWQGQNVPNSRPTDKTGQHGQDYEEAVAAMIIVRLIQALASGDIEDFEWGVQQQEVAPRFDDVVFGFQTSGGKWSYFCVQVSKGVRFRRKTGRYILDC